MIGLSLLLWISIQLGIFQPGPAVPQPSAPPPTGDLLRNCTVNASNVPSCTTPAGWTLLDAQGFESGSLNPIEHYGGSANTIAIDTANAYTGTHSLDTYVQHSFSPWDGMYIAGTNVGSREVYVSMWLFVTQNNPGYGIGYTNWYPILRYLNSGGINDSLTPDWGECYTPTTAFVFGCLTTEFAFFQNNATGSPAPWAIYSGNVNLNMGSWVQYEEHVKVNDPGSTNADFELFQNGVQINGAINSTNTSSRCPGSNCGNWVGTQDFTDAELYIGGDWGQNNYYQDSGHTTCSTDTTNENFAVTATMVPCQCANQCPPSGSIPYFHIYIDDVIVLKK